MTPPAADAPPVPPQPTRVLGRRITLPSGRAVIGAALVTIAVVGLFTAHRRAGARPETAYVVMTRTVAAGSVIGADDLTTTVLDLGALADGALADPEAAVGAVAAHTLVAAHVLRTSNLLGPEQAAPDPSIEVSFSIERSRALEGDLAPGDVVDIVATVDGHGGPCTTVAARSARIMAVGSGSSDVIVPGRHLTLTAAVDNDEALRLIHAATESRLHLTRSRGVGSSPLTGSYCPVDATEPRLAPDEAPTASGAAGGE